MCIVIRIGYVRHCFVLLKVTSPGMPLFALGRGDQTLSRGYYRATSPPAAKLIDQQMPVAGVDV